MTAAKRVLRYLKSTADFQFHFTSNGIGIGIGISIGIDIGNCLVGYSDSDLANDSTDHKSQGGHVFLASNGAISWQSRKQSLIAMSTLEAELIACPEASREAKWLLQLQRIFTVLRKTHHRGQSTATIRVLSLLSPRESSKLELSISTYAIKTVEICIDDE
jgi:hypothetical protein